ncbi:MAG: phosphoribosylamine--glycine ligase [Nitrospirae bacterium]|nr:phosphoribosylamine--glycine ligase [Nitrospirota bacterium]
MNILIIGSGGREHTLAWKISQSSRVKKIYCAPGNGGISQVAQCVPIEATDIPALINFAREKKIAFTVVGPEAPLAAGIVDEFGKENLKIFGPTKVAAELETSKVFAKKMMRKYGIPTGEGEIFARPQEAIAYIREKGPPLVVKADGLAAGKGVIVCRTVEEAEEAVNLIMVKKAFGEAGNLVIVEEYLQGEEASFIALTNGDTIVPLIPSQDHKPIYDGDKGPNTGGMGAYAPARLVSPEMTAEVMEKIFVPTVKGMKEEGRKFQGILYAGLMLTSDGPKVLEFNVRLGDPETQAILPLLESDLIELLESCLTEDLSQVTLQWNPGTAVCVVITSGGYPGKYQTGKEIYGLEELAEEEDVIVFHAGTTLEGGKVVTAGGRVLGVTGRGSDIREAIEKTYQAVKKISFQDMYYRKDIGAKAL